MSPLVSLESLVDLAAKGLVVMLAAAVLALALGRASAAWRHLAWSLGLASLLILPVLSLVLPARRVSWLPQWPSTVGLAQSAPPAAAVIPGDLPQRDLRPAIAPSAPVPPPKKDLTDQPVPAAAPEFAPTATTMDWPTGLVLAWLAGAVLSMTPVAVGLYQLLALRWRSSVVADPKWLLLVNELRAQLQIKRPVQLRQSSSSAVPLTWGGLWPVLLIPTNSDAWPTARRRMVVLHELAHVRRWDWVTQLLAHVACALHWFNPLAWVAARQMRIERERACDDLVLASGAKASDYAQELLQLAASLSSVRLSTLAAVPMARRSGLEDRVRAILDSKRSRAALTTAALGLAVALVAVSIAPLAMLRAAPPDKPASSEPKPAAPPLAKEDPKPAEPSDSPQSQRSPTPAELEARTVGIRISVLNAKGDKGIPEFRVLAGVESSVSQEFEKRTGRKVIVWQPHTLRIGKEGDYVWPLAKAYDIMNIRVEADGYAPQIFAGLKKAAGAQHVVFQMAEDKGVAARILTPAGRPAAGATVALGLVQKDIVWEKGRLRGQGDALPEAPSDQWRRPLFVQTDAEGRFRLPTEYEPAAVLVVHEEGVKELAYDAFQKAPEIKLDGWGRIDGQVLWQDKPGAGEEVTLSIHRDDYGYPGMVASYGRTKTDEQGRFTFERVLPGHVQLSRPMKVSQPNQTGTSEVILDGLYAHLTIRAGEATPALIGGQGRTVKGKLVGLDSWKDVTFHIHPSAPHVGFPGDDQQWQAFSELKRGPLGPILFRDKQSVQADGTFEIKNVLPGNYQLFVSVPGFTNYAASTQARVEEESPGKEPPALDLGAIMVKKPADAPKPDAAPAKEGAAPAKEAATPAPKPEARTVSIRGTAIDDETGLPVGALITQAGKFDPAEPNKVTWGYSEGRSSARDGSFSTSVRWDDGWTARILADGYLPQPVLLSAPPEGKDEIEVTIRLKRGRLVRGQVLDHAGKPVAGAAVFAVGPTGLNLAAGKAWSSIGGNNEEARPVTTDAAGKFELPAGDAKSLAVSASAFDAWPAAIPADGPLTIRLPEPARVDVELNIDGADKESKIFYQLLTHHMPEFAGLNSTREIAISNPGKLSLAALPPGKYQVCRQVLNRVGQFATGSMLDRTFFELKAGETKAIRYVREKGARLRGKAIAPAGTKLSGVVISVQNEKAEKGPFDEHEWTTTWSSQAAAADGSFLTERIPPGTYVVSADGYLPLTEEQLRSTGLIGPAFHAEMKVEVPAEGELAVGDLLLK